MTNSRPPAEVEVLLPAGNEAEAVERTIRDGPSRRSVFRSPRFALLVLVVAVLASYANSLRCAFVYDDYSDIVGNSSISRLWPLGDVFLARSGGSAGLRSRPVVNLSFALDYAVGGLNAVPFHATNLAIHVLAALALFGVVRRALLLPRLRDGFGQVSVPLALSVALLWAMHPLQTESVTYITQRYESLMGLFYLLAVYGLIRSGESEHPFGWGAVTVAATLLALGSKEVAVSLPIMILMFDRLLLGGSFSEIWRRRWGLYVALLAVWASFAVVQVRTPPRPWAGYALHVSWVEYARSQPGVILHYLRLAFWPYPLVFDYGWQPAQSVGEILPGAILVGGLVAATGYAFWRWPEYGLLGAWFFLILAPTSSVMPLADLAVEHRMYLSLAAVVTAVVVGGYVSGRALVRRGDVSTRAATMIGGGLVAVAALTLGCLTWQRNKNYQSEIALWQDTVNKRPNNCRAEDSLACALAGAGQVEAALVHFRKALKINPDDADAYNNLASTLVGHGQVEAALVQYRKALEIRPDNAAFHNNLGAALARLGQVDAAVVEYRKALEINPQYAAAHNNLANTLDNCGQFDEAITHYQKALEIRPDDVSAHYNLGMVLADHERLAEAIEHFQTALGLATARNDRALASAIQAQIRRRQPFAPAEESP